VTDKSVYYNLRRQLYMGPWGRPWQSPGVTGASDALRPIDDIVYGP
jgi:hypothetical protein